MEQSRVPCLGQKEKEIDTQKNPSHPLGRGVHPHGTNTGTSGSPLISNQVLPKSRGRRRWPLSKKQAQH